MALVLNRVNIAPINATTTTMIITATNTGPAFDEDLTRSPMSISSLSRDAKKQKNSNNIMAGKKQIFFLKYRLSFCKLILMNSKVRKYLQYENTSRKFMNEFYFELKGT